MNGNTTYGGQNLDPYEGTLVFQGIKRHAIALGPKLQNPDWVSGPAKGKDMAYGTAVDVAIQMDDGNTYYIPAIITEIKAHTYPTGILQTGDSLASNSNTAKKEGTNIVEWYTVKEVPENKSAGLNYYNTKGSLIIYRDAVLE